MPRIFTACVISLLALSAFADETYFDSSGRDDVLSGGVKMIPIDTPGGTFRVWTKRVGNNPTTKLLLLHGGPAFSHEYLEAGFAFVDIIYPRFRPKAGEPFFAAFLGRSCFLGT